MNWTIGKTLITPTTSKWSSDEIERNNAREAKSIFSDFDYDDLGKSRKLVCTISDAHPDFENNRELIRKAPDLQRVLLEVNRLLDDGIEIHPGSPIHERLKLLLSQHG